jgi:hypothetical protein
VEEPALESNPWPFISSDNEAETIQTSEGASHLKSRMAKAFQELELACAKSLWEARACVWITERPVWKEHCEQ